MPFGYTVPDGERAELIDGQIFYMAHTKLSLYRSAGVKGYWIVDPMKQIILAYDMEHAAAPAIYSFTDKIKANIYEDLYIDFSDIAGQLNI